MEIFRTHLSMLGFCAYAMVLNEAPGLYKEDDTYTQFCFLKSLYFPQDLDESVSAV